MRSALFMLIVAPFLVGGSPVDELTSREPTDRAAARFLVRFENTVRNEGTTVLRDVRCRALLPEEGPGQEVAWVRLSPHGWSLARDSEGQWVGSAYRDELAPGEAVTFGWIASVAFPDRTRDLRSARPGDLADDPAFALDSDEVRAAAAAAREMAISDRPEELLAAALDHVNTHVTYEIDGAWKAAPEVLASGTGSCSETAFALVGICRRLGLPARLAGGTILRSGWSGRAVDATFHRIAEVRLPGAGWVPVETTTPGGEPEGRLLVLSRATGSGGATGPYYHARNEWRAPLGGAARRPATTKRAFWVDGANAPLPDGDPLADLAPGHAASFARCEILLAEAEGYGPSIEPGLIGVSPSRRTRLARTREEAFTTLAAAGHPGALRLATRIGPATARAAIADGCAEDLAADVRPLLDASPAAFEAWWAGASKRITTTARRRLAWRGDPDDGAESLHALVAREIQPGRTPSHLDPGPGPGVPLEERAACPAAVLDRRTGAGCRERDRLARAGRSGSGTACALDESVCRSSTRPERRYLVRCGRTPNEATPVSHRRAAAEEWRESARVDGRPDAETNRGGARLQPQPTTPGLASEAEEWIPPANPALASGGLVAGGHESEPVRTFQPVARVSSRSRDVSGACERERAGRRRRPRHNTDRPKRTQ